MIKAVFFDVGGTLLHPNPSVGDIYSTVARRHTDSAPDAILLNQRFKTAWKKRKEQHLKIDKTWWKDVVTEVFAGVTFKNFDDFFEDLYDMFARKEAWSVFPDAEETLKGLKYKGLRIATASNWDERLPGLLDALGLSRHFERIFTSHELGVVKPNPDFFKMALDQMKVSAIEAIHVGDDPDEDVACAQAAGLRAYHIDRNSKPKNSRSLVSLNEIFVRI